MLNKVNEHQEQEIGQLQRKIKELMNTVTKQPSNFGRKKKKNKTMTKVAKNYSEQSKAAGTKAKTDLPAQVEDFKNQPETQEMQMKESHRQEEEASRLKLTLRETIRTGSKCLV